MDIRNNSKSVRIRILSLGSAGTGKSCLIKRYCEKRFSNKYIPTIGIDYGSTIVDIDGRRVSIHFFDTSGDNIFKDVRSEFYPDMQGILLTYDVCNRDSFVALESLIEELRQTLGPEADWNLVIVVCGTRSDIAESANRQVTEEEARTWAEKRNFAHIITSSSLGLGVSQAFYTLFVQALQLKEGVKARHIPAVVHDPDVSQAIYRLIHTTDDFEKLGLQRRGITKDDVNKAYRRLAGLVHPDKCKASGAEDAFKALNTAKGNLLKIVPDVCV